MLKILGMLIFFLATNFTITYAQTVDKLELFDDFNTQFNLPIYVIQTDEKGDTITKISEKNSLYKISTQNNINILEQYAKVVYKGLANVYLNPNSNSSIIAQIKEGTTVLINSKEGNFYKILFNDTFGYIEQNYLQKTKSEELNLNQFQSFFKVTDANGAYLKADKSENSNTLSFIPTDTYLKLILKEDFWLKVEYMGKTGYINSSLGYFTTEKENNFTNTTDKGQKVVDFAKQFLGNPYIYGSTDLQKGTDCSGFTYSVFANFGININRISKDQYLNGIFIEKSDLQKGDLVFFNTGENTPISHVGIFIGDNQYIHCTDTKGLGVIISRMDSDYAIKTYFGARRVLS